jgi:hypothetical protein
VIFTGKSATICISRLIITKCECITNRVGLVKVINGSATDPKLCQADLLGCLLPLSAVKFEDVRSSLLKGLDTLLQSIGGMLEGGENGGWRVILEVLGSVPLSHTSSVFRSEWINAYQQYWPTCKILLPIPSSITDGNDGQSDFPMWLKETLPDAFASTMLIVDEFTESLLADDALIQSLLEVLSLFGSQTADTNISLTAVEVLWKVADSSIRMIHVSKVAANNGRQVGILISGDKIVEVLFNRLYQLSLDSRPEIRHCAINTFFNAMTNAMLQASYTQWFSVFDDIIVPLFQKAGARSQLAMR